MHRHRARRAHRRRRPGRLLVAALVFTVLPVAVGVAATQVDVPKAPEAVSSGVDVMLEAARARPAPGTASVALADRPVLSDATALPPASGKGHRVVFSQGRQRVWLVSEDGRVERTYPVSGSVYDNLFPGTYRVYSRSENAVGIDDSGTMKWFVRFTRGTAGAAIGFHTIPVLGGEPVQTHAELGTPLSHGCIRQRTADAVALWEFAPLGTTVVVTP